MGSITLGGFAFFVFTRRLNPEVPLLDYFWKIVLLLVVFACFWASLNWSASPLKRNPDLPLEKVLPFFGGALAGAFYPLSWTPLFHDVDVGAIEHSVDSNEFSHVEEGS